MAKKEKTYWAVYRDEKPVITKGNMIPWQVAPLFVKKKDADDHVKRGRGMSVRKVKIVEVPHDR